MVARTQIEQITTFSQPCEFFNHNWQIYQKVLQNNYMKHREFYSVLHQFLVDRHQKPFHLLDLRCGDAYNTTSALIGTSIQAYYGIDIAQVAIALAGNNLAAIPCPKTLIEGNFIPLSSL